MLFVTQLNDTVTMTTQILKLSSADLTKAAALQARIEKHQAELAKLIGTRDVAEPVATGKGRRPLSAARRKRLSQIAKARWKKARVAGKKSL
jgi:uncharacterized small protein (DUF1192 family)